MVCCHVQGGVNFVQDDVTKGGAFLAEFCGMYT